MARLRFATSGIQQDARKAMDAARAEFAKGITVPLNFQNRGGGAPGGAGGAGGGGGGIAGVGAQAAAVQQQTANVTKQLAGFGTSMRQLARTVAVAEAVAAGPSFITHGIKSFTQGDNIYAAQREASAAVNAVNMVPFIGPIVTKLSEQVAETIDATRSALGGGNLESGKDYAARLAEQQKYEVQIIRLQSERARAFMRPGEAAVLGAQEARTTFTTSAAGQELQAISPDLYRRLAGELARQVQVVKKKAALEEERDDFQHEQKLTDLQTRAEAARLDASGAHVQAQRKMLAAGYDAQIRDAEEAAKQYDEVNRDKDADEARQTAASLRDLKSAELERFDVRNRFIGFTSAGEMWKRLNEATARYSAEVKKAGDATATAGKQMEEAGEKGKAAGEKTAGAWEKAAKAADDATKAAANAARWSGQQVGTITPNPMNPTYGAGDVPPVSEDVDFDSSVIVGGMDLGGDYRASQKQLPTAPTTRPYNTGNKAVDAALERARTEQAARIAANIKRRKDEATARAKQADTERAKRESQARAEGRRLVAGMEATLRKREIPIPDEGEESTAAFQYDYQRKIAVRPEDKTILALDASRVRALQRARYMARTGEYPGQEQERRPFSESEATGEAAKAQDAEKQGLPRQYIDTLQSRAAAAEEGYGAGKTTQATTMGPEQYATFRGGAVPQKLDRETIQALKDAFKDGMSEALKGSAGKGYEVIRD